MGSLIIGVRVIPYLDQREAAERLAGDEVLRVDVGLSEGWIVGADLHVIAQPSPLVLPRYAVGVTRAVNAHELVQHMRALADAIERYCR